MADRFPLIANSSTSQIQELSVDDNLNLAGNSVVGVVSIFASGNISVGGTLTYEDVTNVDAVGLITARSGISISDGGLDVTGISTIKGAVETTSAGAYSGTELTCDTTTGTVFTHDLQSGLVKSIKISNFPATANSFHTVTIILTQNDAGTAHTTAALGIGTNVTLDPDGVTGFSTVAMVGSGTTVTLGTTADDINIISFGIHYNGGTNTDVSNYKTFVTKNVKDTVKISRDSYAVPYISGLVASDSFFALGYAHAQDRLWQMEFQVMAAGGRLSEIIGAKALEYDKFQRRIGMMRGAESVLEYYQQDSLMLSSLIACFRRFYLAIHRKLRPDAYSPYETRP